LRAPLFDDKTIAYRLRENKHPKKFNHIVDINNLLENPLENCQESLKFMKTTGRFIPPLPSQSQTYLVLPGGSNRHIVRRERISFNLTSHSHKPDHAPILTKLIACQAVRAIHN
jgi:hypothetical protein